MQTLQSTEEKAKFSPTERHKYSDANQQEVWQDFANLAAQTCGMPMAMIVLREDNQLCLRWQVGLSQTAAEREIDFCLHVIEQKKVLVVPDAFADRKFNTEQIATSDSPILSYAGVPLVSSEGIVVGVISVMDYIPQQLSPQQLAALQALARQLSKQLELRQDLVKLAQALQESEEREDKLRNSEQELLDFIENGTVAMHWVDVNGIIIWANQAELSLLGYSQEEYIGHHIAEFHADEAVIADILKRLTANETLKNYEARLKSKDGSIKYVLINSNVLWEDSKFNHTRCFSNDITERKQAEIALEQATQENLKLVRVLDAVSNGVIITDAKQADNPIIYLNPAFSKITGYSPEEIKGRNCRLLQGKDTDLATIALIRRSLRQGQEVETSLLNYRKDGKPFWNELKIFPVFAEEGDLLYFVGIMTDVTERKLAEQERDRFFNLSRDILCVSSFDGYFKRVNPAFSKILGYDREELCTQPLINFVHPEDQATTLKEIEKLSADKPTIYFENRYRTLDGSYRWIAWTATPVVEESLIYATGRDITNSKQVQQERLQLLEREKVARAEAEAVRHKITKILESITDGFFALDKKWRFTYINALAEPLLQRKREELLGKCIWGKFPEAVGSLFYQGYHRAVSKQVKVAFEAFYPPLECWFSVHAYPSDEGLYVYFDDITQRKHAEEALRQSEERFQLIAQATN
ncbi:MAG: PAS domain S-box protein, partial [Coleofasciculaceae cyanobacterium]